MLVIDWKTHHIAHHIHKIFPIIHHHPVLFFFCQEGNTIAACGLCFL